MNMQLGVEWPLSSENHHPPHGLSILSLVTTASPGGPAGRRHSIGASQTLSLSQMPS